MNLTDVITLLLFVAFFVAGAAAAFYFEIDAGLNFFGNEALDLAILCAGIFVLSIMFFGYLAALPVFIAGLVEGAKISSDIAFVALSALPIFMAAYAGSALGRKLLADIQGKENFTVGWKKTAVLLIVSLVLALIIGASKPILHNLFV